MSKMVMALAPRPRAAEAPQLSACEPPMIQVARSSPASKLNAVRWDGCSDAAAGNPYWTQLWGPHHAPTIA